MAQMFVDAIGAGIQSARCPVAYINQVMQPITGYTRVVMERGQVPYVIPGLRQAVVALRNIAWWSLELESLEVNPLRVDGATIEALDAVVTWTSEEDI